MKKFLTFVIPSVIIVLSVVIYYMIVLDKDNERTNNIIKNDNMVVQPTNTYSNTVNYSQEDIEDINNINKEPVTKEILTENIRSKALYFQEKHTDCGKTAQDFYEDMVRNINSDFSPEKVYVYTESVVAPDGKKYSIRKESSDGCGRNGSLICDLVVEDSQKNKEFVADLLFPSCLIASNGEKFFDILNSAKLLSFIDNDNIFISFLKLDHGVDYSEIVGYNIETKKITKNVLSFNRIEGAWVGKSYDEYRLCENDSCLVFTDKISFITTEEVTDIENQVEYPYEVKFNAEENYQNLDIVKLIINKNLYTFNFKNKSLDLVN